MVGDGSEVLASAAVLVRDAYCEPVVVDGLDEARRFQRVGPGFRANTNAAALKRPLGVG